MLQRASGALENGVNPDSKKVVHAANRFQVFDEFAGPNAHCFLSTPSRAEHFASEDIQNILPVAEIPVHGDNVGVKPT